MPLTWAYQPKSLKDKAWKDSHDKHYLKKKLWEGSWGFGYIDIYAIFFYLYRSFFIDFLLLSTSIYLFLFLYVNLSFKYLYKYS